MAIIEQITNDTRNTITTLDRRLLGAFYTPSNTAEFMANWSLRRDGEEVLEPSFGDGIFIRAIYNCASARGINRIHVSGVEIDKKAIIQASNDKMTKPDHLLCNDFMNIRPFKVHSVIGNPPYVRLRKLSAMQRELALKQAHRVLGYPMDPSGSLWMPFVLHSIDFLNYGGRLAFILPYDFTYVRYAKPLWQILQDNFGSIQVIRTHERLFSELLQDVVILFADNFGMKTNSVRYSVFEKVRDLPFGNSVVDESIPIAEILSGKRAFIEALLDQELRELLQTRIENATYPARELVTFHIGYVAGDKDYFHPDNDQVIKYRLPSRSLYSSLTSTRAIRNVGLWSSKLANNQVSKLFLPNPKKLTKGEKKYLHFGSNIGINNRHKCQVRDPWYVVPGTRVPDVVLTVFSERPVLQVNDARYYASNSLLCGFASKSSSEDIATRWYTSLTLLQCELEIHALGGGVMIVVPREAGNIRLPRKIVVRKGHLSKINRKLSQGKVTEAYHSGDEYVLINQLGFSNHEIELIHNGIDILTHWRTSARSSLV